MKKNILLIFLAITTLPAFSSVSKKIRISLQDTISAITDNTDIFLDLGVSADFIFPEDGSKIIDPISTAPIIYSFTDDNIACFSNSYGAFTQPEVIALGFKIGGNSTYRISAASIEGFDETTIIRLEDRETGNFYDLRSRSCSVYIATAQQNNSRFFVHISYPTLITNTTAGCSNDDGRISITQDPSITWNSCILLNEAQNIIGSYNNVTGMYDFAGLAQGNYSVVFAYGSYSATKNVVLAGNYVSTVISASTAYASVNQLVQFYGVVTNCTNLTWAFGEGSIITGVNNPEFSFTLPGTYTITLNASNTYGCSSSAQFTLIVSEATSLQDVKNNLASIKTFGRAIEINLNADLNDNLQFKLYNLNGSLIAQQPLHSSVSTINLNTPQAGIYVAAVSNGTDTYATKIVLQ